MSIKTALSEINNAVLDLQASDYNTFERPLERLALALNSEHLKDISGRIKSKADLEEFIANADKGGSMIGSARLKWPPERERELGLVIQIIERSAEDPHWFLNFAHTYFYSGRKIVGDIRKITSSVIIPFNRDFASFVEELTPDRKDDQVAGTTSPEDMGDLLKALYDLSRHTNKRPSVQDAGMKYFPEWARDRLLNAAQGLLESGAILNPKGLMLNVDLSSSSRKQFEVEAPIAQGVTYNIGSMHHSPLQHIAAGSQGSQTVNYSSDDLRSIISLYRQNVDDLDLDDTQRRRADAQVATIEAQLIDEPDPYIIKAAGRSLKTIVEGAIGGAAGSAIAAAPIWGPLLSLFS